MEERRAEIAEADQGDRPLAIQSEDAAQLGFEAGHVIPDAADAELAEVRQVLAHLRRVQVVALGQLLGGDGLHTVFFQLLETPRVHGEPAHGHLRNLGKPVIGTTGHRRGRGRRRAPAPTGPPTL